MASTVGAVAASGAALHDTAPFNSARRHRLW